MLTEVKSDEIITPVNSQDLLNITSTSLPTFLLSSRFYGNFEDTDIELEDKTKKDEKREIKIQEDDSVDIIDSWEKVKVEFLDDSHLNILFGKMSLNSKAILIQTNDNQEIVYDLDFSSINNFTNDNFNWKSKIKTNNPTIQITEIFIKDLEDKFHLIYLK